MWNLISWFYHYFLNRKRSLLRYSLLCVMLGTNGPPPIDDYYWRKGSKLCWSRSIWKQCWEAMVMKSCDDYQSTSIATHSYCYLSIPRVFPHELRALPEMAAKRKGMANPPHRASIFIAWVASGLWNFTATRLIFITDQFELVFRAF